MKKNQKTMVMEEAWKKIYEKRAKEENRPDYSASYWSEQGFIELIETLKQILKKEKKNQTILDVGCGPGNFCKILSEEGFEVTGIDYSEAMIKRAKKNCTKSKFLVGDAYKIPYKENSFDITISIGVITCLSDYEKAIEELKRVTKKKIIISTLRRNRKVQNVKSYINYKLLKDDWPTLEYHPDELIELFPKNEYETEIITHLNNEPLRDGFFLIATKKTKILTF
ncbi:methyltransferase domain-containing protein [Candidatus Woesearchaeota archaeon]|nr:methyltransferase domain-containing protein [Candidatus Woesearchaeota archaeon]MCF7901504.1 methyltransferase domain-containing protein [Candidatus Woesearchaeota archaeon]MCF8013926.1 methyltransferase domain-containing protein [Candidatus Woesearchaeota archaeon]